MNPIFLPAEVRDVLMTLVMEREGQRWHEAMLTAQALLSHPQPAEVSSVEGVEQPEVVAWRWKYQIPKELQGSEWDWSFATHWSTGPKDSEPLMTLAQHHRITAQLRAECERLRTYADGLQTMASSVGAAMKAERDQLRARVGELENQIERAEFNRRASRDLDEAYSALNPTPANKEQPQ